MQRGERPRGRSGPLTGQKEPVLATVCEWQAAHERREHRTWTFQRTVEVRHGGPPTYDVYGREIVLYGWLASASCTCCWFKHTDGRPGARAWARSHRREMEALGHAVGCDRRR